MKALIMVMKHFSKWSLERLPFWLVCFAGACALAVVVIQVGIWHGRCLEKAEIEEEIEALRANINALEAETARLQREAIVAEVIDCESAGRHNGVWGDGGRSYGIAQFQRRTFTYLAEKSGVEGLDWKDRDDQIWLLRWSIDNGYGDLWTCYRKIKGIGG